MSFRRYRRSPVAVEFRGVSIPRTFVDGGEPFTALPEVPPVRSNVHRLFDLDRIGSRSFGDIAPGYGGRLEPPMQTLRRIVRSPVTSAAVRVGRFPVRPPASPQSRATWWREFNALKVDRRVSFCVRRLQRKQVLFALKVAGRRGGSPGPYRRRQESQWSCV